jgi:hypothetical protein
MWSDTNLSPFMAITAHWIKAEQGSNQQPRLALRADLIGFIPVPGRHTGEHLAHAFIHVLDRIHVTEKVVPYFRFLFGLIQFRRLVGLH